MFNNFMIIVYIYKKYIKMTYIFNTKHSKRLQINNQGQYFAFLKKNKGFYINKHKSPEFYRLAIDS